MRPSFNAEQEQNSANADDLFFKCGRCGTSLVVDRAAAGMTLTCEGCGEPTTVPTESGDASSPLASPSRAVDNSADLRRQLEENESQRTEITSYINQLNIQVHRWQLRLQTLNDRKAELTTEIASLTTPSSP